MCATMYFQSILIRKGDPMVVGIASKRMYNYFNEWLYVYAAYGSKDELLYIGKGSGNRYKHSCSFNKE